jgi:hypothetical protein
MEHAIATGRLIERQMTPEERARGGFRQSRARLPISQATGFADMEPAGIEPATSCAQSGPTTPAA